MWRQRLGAPAWPAPAWCRGIFWAGAGRSFISWHPFGWACRSCWELSAVVQGEGSGVRAGEMLLAHARVAQSLQRSSAGTLRGRDSHRFSLPFSPWLWDWRRLERGAAAPSEEGCVSPGQGSQGLPQSRIPFPADTGLCSWPDWLQQLLPFLSWYSPVTISSVTTCLAQELLCHPVSGGTVVARPLVLCSPRPS